MGYLEKWTVDGYDLTANTDHGWEVRTGVGKAGGLVGTNTQVPYSGGELWHRKFRGPGSFTFNMWLAGADAGDAQRVYDELLRQVIRGERLVRWTRTPNPSQPFWPARYCDGETVGTIEPTYVGSKGYKFGVEVVIPDGRWHSVSVGGGPSSTGADMPKQIILSGTLGTSTTSMDDLTYYIYGPLDKGWTLRDVYGPDFLVGNEAVPAGKFLVIDASAWGIAGGSADGSAGYTPNIAAYEPHGPKLMTVAHGTTSSFPIVELAGTGAGSTTKLVIAGQASYLT